MTSRLAVFQMHHTDLEEQLLETNAVARTVASGLFDHVVVAAADVPENRALQRYADAFGAELVLGDERNVARRIADCAEERGADLVARSLVWWFFQDLDLVARQLDTLERSDAEGLLLPAEFDLRFGADVFRTRWARRVGDALTQDDERFARHGLNPWSWVEAEPELHAFETFADTPTFDRARFEEIRGTMRRLWPDRWDGAAAPMTPYRLALEHFPEGGHAIDVACGLGAGTALLAERGKVLGVDVDEEAVERARARSSAEFIVGDVLALDLPGDVFDLAVSVHTMEHVDDDRTFLARLHDWMRPGGTLVLEVPLLLSEPFRGVEVPLSPGHVREYAKADLLAKIAEHFEVEQTFGVARGAYVALERARNAAGVIARKR